MNTVTTVTGIGQAFSMKHVSLNPGWGANFKQEEAVKGPADLMLF